MPMVCPTLYPGREKLPGSRAWRDLGLPYARTAGADIRNVIYDVHDDGCHVGDEHKEDL